MVKIQVKQLIWDDWNTNHIQKHQVTIEEVELAIGTQTKTLRTYQKRFLILGRSGKKLLTVVLAQEKNKKYYVVTARDMSQKERRYYREQNTKV
jgi:uncharacterized DUF497 family protein